MTSNTRPIPRKRVVRKAVASEKESHPRGGHAAVRKEPEVRDNMPYFGRVNLRIHGIECIKTTKEIDRDEITLAAIKVEGRIEKSDSKEKLAARAERGEVLNAGKFNKGDSRRYNPPRTVATFPSGGKDMEWPRYYYATLVMIEQDEGAIGKIVNEVLKSVEKEVAEVVSKAVSTLATAAVYGAAGTAVGSAVPFIGSAVGAAAGASIGLIAGEIKKARKDDVLDPKNVELERFASKGGEIEGSKRKAVFRDLKGHYVVTYSWSLS